MQPLVRFFVLFFIGMYVFMATFREVLRNIRAALYCVEGNLCLLTGIERFEIAGPWSRWYDTRIHRGHAED